jgi:cellulose synthase (UDP-forming)
VLNWLCKPFIVLMLVAPSIYWLFDMPAFHADYLSFLRYGLPTLFALWTYSSWVSGRRTLPLFMEVTHIMTALAITLTLASAAIRPFGRPFKVTDKGGDRSVSMVRWRMAAGFGAITLLSAGAIVWSFVSPSGATEISSLDYFNLIWAGVAMLFCFVAFLVCFERPRGAEEFRIEEPVRVRSGGVAYDAVLATLGMETARLRLTAPGHAFAVGDGLDVLIEPTGWVPANFLAVQAGNYAVALAPNPLQRRTLILRLFTQAVDPIARTASLRLALRGLIARCFRAT